ncbi:MAG: amidohydrolase family protein [Polyangiales bacterium]
MNYRWIDADGHYYEPDDCFTRHIEQKFKAATVRVDRSRGDGLGRIYVGDKRTFMSAMPGDYASAPGAKLGLFSGKQDDGFAHKEVINAKDHPAFTDRHARLAFMDEQGLEATLMLPTLAVAVEEDLAHDVELTYASLRSFNRWLEEDWSYGTDGRLYGVPMLSLLSLDHALVEVQRVLAAGAKLVHLRPGPVGGQSPAHPMFDKFWATLAEAGVGVVFHVSNSGYNRAFGALWSENPKNPSHNQSPLQWALCNTERPIVDTLTAITLHNLFGRHPDIRIISIENGSGWLKSVCKNVDKAAALGRQGPQIGGKLPTKPSEALLEHLWISPFPEDDIGELLGLLGPDHVLFGSDYPHPEGLRLPRDYLELIEGLDEVSQRKVLRSNTAQLIGLEQAAG